MISPWLEVVIVIAAGAAAGTINAIVGSGTLVTFPVLITLGYPPVVATMSNAVGLVPGGLSGTWGYRRELAGQRRTILKLLPASALGAVTGAVLLFSLPERSFEVVVPVLIIGALCLVMVQPRLQRLVKARRESLSDESSDGHVGPILIAAVGLAGVYGGYFAAAQGVLLMGILGVMLAQDLQMSNGLKNLLVGVVNLVAATIYTVAAHDRIAWAMVGCIAIGAVIGGWLGARIGRRLSPTLLRGAIVVLGVTALWRILA